MKNTLLTASIDMTRVRGSVLWKLGTWPLVDSVRTAEVTGIVVVLVSVIVLAAVIVATDVLVDTTVAVSVAEYVV